MIDITINGIEYTLPESWDEVSLGVFREMAALSKKPYTSAFDTVMKTLSIMAEDDSMNKEIRTLPLNEVLEIMKICSWVHKTPIKFNNND